MWLHVLKYIRQSIQSFHSLSLFVIVFQKSLMSFFLIEFKSIENLPPSKGWDLERLRSAELHQAVGISACPSVWIRGQDAASSCVESKLKLWCLLYFSNWRLLSLEFVPANAKWQKLRTKMIFLRDLPNAAPPGGLTNWLDKALSVLAQKKPLRLDSGLFVTLLRRILHLSQLAQRKYSSFPAVCHEWHEWVELPVKKSRTITSPLHVSSQAPSSLSSKDGCAKGVSFGDRLKPVWCIKITSCQPTVCVSLHSIDYLILQVKIWSIKSFGFFEGIAVQPFCVMVISLCVCIYCPTVPGQHYRMMHGPLLSLWKPRFVWSGWIDWFVIGCCFLPWKMKMETSECVFPKKFGPLCLSY